MIKNFGWLFRHAAGRMHPFNRQFVPDVELPRIYLEARLMLLLYATLLGVSLATGSLLVAIYWFIPTIIGVPVEDHRKFHAGASQINGGPLHPEAGRAASQAMRDYLTPIVEDRRARPQADLISDIVHAKVDGEQLDDEHIYVSFRCWESRPRGRARSRRRRRVWRRCRV